MNDGRISQRGIKNNGQHFDQTNDVLNLLLDPNGNLDATAAGLRVTRQNPTDFRGVIDPTADGGTSPLPTPAGADTTVENGENINAGDTYIVATAGTIGTGIVVTHAPAELISNVDNPTVDGDWTLIQGVDTSLLVPNTRTIFPGAGLVGNVALDFSADRVLDIGAGDGITVNQDNIAVNPAELLDGGAVEMDGDKLNITYTPTNYTPDTTPAETDAADQLTAHLAAIDAKLASAGRRVEVFTLVAADITNGFVALAVAPEAATIIVHWSEGNIFTNGQGVTVAGVNVDFSAATATILAGDTLTVNYLPA